MQLLSAINYILPKLGEHPVTSAQGTSGFTKHPTVAVIMPELEQNTNTLLQQGWWFNSFKYTAHPGPTGEITLSSDVLSFVPDPGQLDAVQRGTELINPETLLNNWSGPIKGRITVKVAFDELPEVAANVVLLDTLVTVYVADIGLEQNVQVWMQQAAEARRELLAEHLRHRKYDTRQSRRYRNLRRAMRGT